MIVDKEYSVDDKERNDNLLKSDKIAPKLVRLKADIADANLNACLSSV